MDFPRIGSSSKNNKQPVKYKDLFIGSSGNS